MCYVQFAIYDFVCRVGLWLVVLVLSAAVAGCSNRLLDPAQIGRFRPTPAVNVILDSLGVAEETPVAWADADEPRPQDIVAAKGDYVLRAGDLVRISIFELFQEGATVVNDYVVSETGKISIPEVGVMQAAGLTEAQLEQEIRQVLSPSVLKEPSVTVALMNSQQRTFSILGNGVPQPGRYSIPRYDFRLTDALATAGGPMQFNVSHIYITRGRDPVAVPPAVRPAPPDVGELELVEPQSSQEEPLPPPIVRPPTPSLTVPQGEIPVPSEPVEKFELEREMLDLIVKEKWLTANAVYGIYPANSIGDDLVLFTDESRTKELTRFINLRNQTKKEPGTPNLSLSDYIAPLESGKKDYLGAFANTAGLGIEERIKAFEADHDDYSSIMIKALADRLAEAFTELLHTKIRKETWGYAPDENLSMDELFREKYSGIRPAHGYPACPEHSEKETLFNLLECDKQGIELTENYSMYPAASVSGLIFAHPASKYFFVGKIGKDQVQDYAKRKGMSEENVKRLLASNLNFNG